MNRLTLTKIHMILAAFMFPAALMFLVTGGLYTWGVTGDYATSEHPVTLTQPLTDDKDALVAVATAELDRLGLARPSGSPRVRSTGDAFHLEWTGSNADVLLHPTDQPLVATLEVKDTSWYRTLVQLHKAKGGTLFKVYAAALAVALFLILATGFVMAWQVPRFRRVTAIATAAGLASFAAAVALS